MSETGGHPVVYGDWLHAPDAPTVLVYGHYDVQPVDPIELWETAPFEPFVKGERMIGRGSADDKGQIHIHLRATEAILATRGALPVNLKFVFEGEEESSSVHLDAWLAANKGRLAADLAVISDTGFFEGNLPAITIGLRGICYVQVDVTGTAVDLHSGQFGGAVQNPANALAQIIAALKGPDGRIRVPGFYDDVVALSEADRAAFAALPFDEDALPDGPRPAGPRRRGRLHDPRAARRPADPRRQRAVGRLRGRRGQDDHPGSCPRQDQLPAGHRPGPGHDLRAAAGVRRSRSRRPAARSR